MNDQTIDIIERLRAGFAGQAGDGAQTSAAMTITAADAGLLLARLDELQNHNDELRRRAVKGNEMIDAAAAFLAAYGKKYRNFAGGGMRPTAILLNEVKVMWAVMEEFRTVTESEA